MKTRIVIAIAMVLVGLFLINWLPKVISESGILNCFWSQANSYFDELVHLP